MDDSGTSSCCDTGISSTCDTGIISTCDTGLSNNCDSGTGVGGINDNAFSYDNFTVNTYAHAIHHDPFMHATNAMFPANYGPMDTNSAPSGRPPPYSVSDHVVRFPGDSSVNTGVPMMILTPEQLKKMQRHTKRKKCIPCCLVLVLLLAGFITAIILTVRWFNNIQH